jgi:molecular chaperone DnaK (HSP70)
VHRDRDQRSGQCLECPTLSDAGCLQHGGLRSCRTLNEPSAAGFEYAHRYRSTITGKREYVVIYDLGGGTFDASLVKMTERWNEVVTSEGIQRLGGDDFDEVILKLVLDGSNLGELDTNTRDLLLEECTARKEAVGPNTRRFLVDLSAADRPPFSRPMDDVYAACAPLVDRTVEVLTRVLRDPARQDGQVEWAEIAGIYMVGRAGGFPLVGRMLRKSFGEKTPYDPVFFPFDPDLQDEDDLRHRPVGRREFGPDVEECYVVTPSGGVEVIITTRPSGLTRTFQLARHVPASL